MTPPATARRPANSSPSASKSSTPAGDRFSGRRLEARREAGRRRLLVVAVLAGVSSLAVALIALSNSALFDVDEIVVTGLERADRASVVQASAVHRHQPLIEIDPGVSARRVEQVPWIGAAEVRRSWSGRVEIVVVEREPVAALPTVDGGYALVDRWGRQLETTVDRPEGFPSAEGPLVSGVAGQLVPAEAEPLLALVELMVPSVRERVDTINLVDGALVVDLSVGGEARFGDGTQMEAKVQTLETVLERVDLQCLAVIDLSVPSAPSVRRIDENPSPSGEGNQEPKAATSGC